MLFTSVVDDTSGCCEGIVEEKAESVFSAGGEMGGLISALWPPGPWSVSGGGIWTLDCRG